MISMYNGQQSDNYIESSFRFWIVSFLALIRNKSKIEDENVLDIPFDIEVNATLN